MSIEKGRGPIWSKVAATGMAASVALAGCTANPETPAPSATVSIHVLPTPTESYVPPHCSAQASPTDISAAGRLMAEPGNKYLQLTPMDYQKRQIGINAVTVASARRYGLTVFSERQLADSWYNKVNNSKHSPSFQAVFNLVHGYMEKFGVDLEIGKVNDPNYAYGSRRPTTKELDTRTTKNDLIDTMTAFSTVPAEYLSLAGLKHIYLVAGTNKNAEGYTDAASDKNDRYYKDIKEADGPEVDLHELSHMVDSKECQGLIFDDPAWTKLNHGVNLDTSNTNDTSHISYEDRYIIDDVKRTSAEISATETHNAAKYCQLKAAGDTEAAQVMSYSNYHTNSAEDKAETMKNMAYDYGWAGVTSKQFPVLYNKFRLSLARLYHVAPRIAEYFAAISNRSYTYVDPKAPKC